MKKKILSACLGYPRIGQSRELKRATESYWKGTLDEGSLKETAKEIRKVNWLTQKEASVDIIPSNDFSFYDQMLDMIALFGAVPQRFEWKVPRVNIDIYFTMARGIQEKQGFNSESVPAMEMTKWFDTNYHYIVPEFQKSQTFKLATTKPLDEYQEALALGIETRPVLIGPVTFLQLGKAKGEAFNVFELLQPLLQVYRELFVKLEELGCKNVQIDEPALVLDLTKEAKESLTLAYEFFAKEIPGINLMLTTYFGALEDNLPYVAKLPVSGLHIDLVRGLNQLEQVEKSLPRERVISLGVVDGRNIWKLDATTLLDNIKPFIKKSKREDWIIAPSCSLIHTPIDLNLEKNLGNEIKSWMAFAKQKLDELRMIKTALTRDVDVVLDALKDNRQALESRRRSRKIHVADVKKRVDAVRPEDLERKNAFPVREKIQSKKLGLPVYPTTTIGSFPQTKEIRQARLKFKKKEMSGTDYQIFLEEQTKDAITKQSEIGLDVFVHGEFERNDMVEYFGEKLEGFVFTGNGWVQSYGSRYVKPPVIFGDVWRKDAMTVKWYEYAQSLTHRPVKGMLTGPITILQWSFVRDDQARSVTARQIGLAIRDEVLDLEAAGTKIIQIDEPAIREGLPLRQKDWKTYLEWAVDAFKLSASGVKDETQIHTHMCYSEFNDIIESIARMDADVISIETSRSQMELLDVFAKFKYPNQIGPGVYDIHSPRVPGIDEIEQLLTKASKVIPAKNIWVNPDCGLKTRGWDETMQSLSNMVETAKTIRKRCESPVNR